MYIFSKGVSSSSPGFIKKIKQVVTSLEDRPHSLGPHEQGGACGEREAQRQPYLQQSPPSSRTMHPNTEDVRQNHQEACMDEGAPGQTQTQEENLRTVEGRMGNLGQIQRH